MMAFGAFKAHLDLGLTDCGERATTHEEALYWFDRRDAPLAIMVRRVIRARSIPGISPHGQGEEVVGS
jgi:hypothetical protein